MQIVLIKAVVFLAPLLHALSLHAQQPVDTTFAIPIGEINQWISIKGSSATNPVLLFLHGGPGNSVMGYSQKFTDQLQKNFLVVQWDQRESGKTAALNKSPQPLSVAIMEEDVIEVINYLRAKYAQEKIYLMGHSWGGFLGLLIAARRPNLLKGCIAICPMIDQRRSEAAALEWLRGKASAGNNKLALSELAGVRIPFENGEQLYFHRKWINNYMGGKIPAKAMVVSWSDKWLNLFNEASAMNLFELAPSLDCPVYFFAGSKDIQTSTKLTTEYYNAVKAESKRLFIFEGVAHNLPTSEPVKLQQTIIREVLGKFRP
ncbi:MAG: alpha/beta hydrolase [Chryseolinea sp.]